MKTTTVFQWFGINNTTKKEETGINYTFDEVVGYLKAVSENITPYKIEEIHYHSAEGKDLQIRTPTGTFILPDNESVEIAPNVREHKEKGYPVKQLVKIYNIGA